MKPVDGVRLEQLYSELPVPDGSTKAEEIVASPIDEASYYRIGRDVHGHPVLLIATPTRRESSEVLRSMRLKRLTVQHDVQCMVTDPAEEKSVEISLSLIRCTDETLTQHFLRIAASLINSLGSAPTRKQVSQVVARLADLFQALSRPMRGAPQGLWSELFLISRSADPFMLVGSWHIDPDDRFDFAHGVERLEVKSFSGSSRRHHFTLDQIRPVEKVEVVVASIQTVSSKAGPSIAELVHGIQGMLSDPDAALRVEHVVAEVLGDSLDEEFGRRFDAEIARETLRFFRAEDIPSVSPDIPRGVYGIRFISDLDGITEFTSIEGALFTFATAQKQK